jgi:hypothetical protein
MRIVNFVLPAILAAVLATFLIAVPFTTARAASGHDFDSVVSAVEQRYSAHAERVPMMGFVSFCAHIATAGGVKGMKIAEFDNLPNAPGSAELESLLSNTLGGSWQRFVTDRSRNGDVSIIYVQPDGSAMRMLIADYEHGELDLVRMEVNGERLAHWVHDPEGSAHRHDYGTDQRGVPD